jgi:hypothetical protein
VRATRRAAVTTAGVAVVGLGGCTSEASTPSSGQAPSSSSTTSAAEADPDRVALDRAVEITTTLLAELAEAVSASDSRLDPDPGGRFLALHTAHLAALDRAAGATASASPTPDLPTEHTTRPRLRRHEAGAQRELAHLAQEAASGALARLLASMSAGIAAHLAVPTGP